MHLFCTARTSGMVPAWYGFTFSVRRRPAGGAVTFRSARPPESNHEAPSSVPDPGRDALAVRADRAANRMIDPDTGHRVIRLSREDGTASLYFHQNAYSADGKKLVVTNPHGIATIDLATRAIDQVVEGRCEHPRDGPQKPASLLHEGKRHLRPRIWTPRYS